MEQEKTDAPVKKGGRPVGSTNAPRKYAKVKWKYTLDQFREDYDVEKDEVVLVPVEDFEKKVYTERVPLEQITRDGGTAWELERNERLARAGKKNRIRVINWFPEGDDADDNDSDVIDGEKDGVKVAIANAGVTNG